jgi:AcrR family transcriptional regulator
MVNEAVRAEAGSAYHHGDLRRAILASTLEIINSAGLEAVSLRRVARHLNVSEAAPYHHFASKQDLLAVLATDAYRGLGKRLTSALESAGSDPFDRLRACLRAYIDYGLESRGRYRLMFGEHMVDLGAYLRAEGHDPGPTRVILEDLIAECVGTTEDAKAIENTAWALSHGITGLIGEAEIRLGANPDAVQHLVEVGISILTEGIRSYLRSNTS